MVSRTKQSFFKFVPSVKTVKKLDVSLVTDVMVNFETFSFQSWVLTVKVGMCAAPVWGLRGTCSTCNRLIAMRDG